MTLELTSFARIALALDAPDGQPPRSMRPALESLMKTLLGRLP